MVDTMPNLPEVMKAFEAILNQQRKLHQLVQANPKASMALLNSMTEMHQLQHHLTPSETMIVKKGKTPASAPRNPKDYTGKPVEALHDWLKETGWTKPVGRPARSTYRHPYLDDAVVQATIDRLREPIWTHVSTELDIETPTLPHAEYFSGERGEMTVRFLGHAEIVLNLPSLFDGLPLQDMENKVEILYALAGATVSVSREEQSPDPESLHVIEPDEPEPPRRARPSNVRELLPDDRSDERPFEHSSIERFND